MTVKEVIDMAKFGELRNLKLGALEDQIIITYINLGLIELYKRFPLSVKETIIDLAANTPQTEYPLPTDFMWLVSAYGEVPENAGYDDVAELSVNDEFDPLSINTVSWDKVQIPYGIDGAYVSLVYVAAPDGNQKIEYDEAGVYLTKELSLPAQLIESLLFYIGYRAYGAMNGNINSESSTHYTRFEQSCKRIEKEGMFTSESMRMKRIKDKGFV